MTVKDDLIMLNNLQQIPLKRPQKEQVKINLKQLEI